MNESRELPKKMNAARWETLLRRWCESELTGEAKLVCAVIASAIADEEKEAHIDGRVPYESGFFERGFDVYCLAVGLNPSFVREQINVARLVCH
jgi:hypothetical protein